VSAPGPDADGSWWHRPRLRDGVVAVVLAVTTATSAFGSGDFFGPSLAGVDDRYPPLWLGLPWGVAVGALAFVRRRWPTALVAGAIAANMVVAAHVAVMVALYTFAKRTLSRPRVAAATITAAVLGGIPIWRFGGADGAIPITVAFCVVPAMFGLYAGTRRELIARIRERAERSEREQHQRIAQARSDERARIARDMHDVLTHRVALMVLQATALEATADRDAAVIARQIGETGREALTELRSLVEVLRRDDEVPIAPQPGVADLDALIETSRRLGLPVTLDIKGVSDHPLPLLADHAVYRVVQEALTNVHKHAPGARTHVRIDREQGGLHLSVRNGRGREPHGGRLPAGGHGLIGVTERIRLVGGSCTTRAFPTGGYELEAVIPLPDGGD